MPFVIPIIQRIDVSIYNQKNRGNYQHSTHENHTEAFPSTMQRNKAPALSQSSHSFYHKFFLFFLFFFHFLFSCQFSFLFTVWNRHESPQESVLDTAGTSLRLEPTRSRILSMCTCVRICKYDFEIVKCLRKD